MIDVVAKFPESVRNYLSIDDDNRGIRMSVDALLEIDLGTVPPSLEFAELPQFFRARAAAELTRVEWVQALHLLWQYIWGANISRDWQIEPVKSLAKNWVITIKECWESREISVRHSLGGFELYTAIGLYHDRLEVGFSLETGKIFHIKGEPAAFAWQEKPHDWEDWNLATCHGNIIAKSDLIEDAKKLADEALTHCNEIAGKR